MNKPKKVGRPRIAIGVRKDRVVTVRLSGNLLNQTRAAAQMNNQTVAEWIRTTIFLEGRFRAK